MEHTTDQQIENLIIKSDKPLLIVDADEVLLHFAKPFANFLNLHGWQLNLTGYRLDNAIIHKKEGHCADKERSQELVKMFITQETHRQPATEGAVETLESHAKSAQIIILSNVPIYAHKDREKNLKALNMNYPLISNQGPKGPVLGKLSSKTTRKTIFIDDSPFQIDSAAKHAPKIFRFHFTACELVKKTLPYTQGATHRPKNWPELNKLINKFLY